jgi:hypothetical protein
MDVDTACFICCDDRRSYELAMSDRASRETSPLR